MSILTPPVSTSLPRLESGDCMTRDEFERRYEALPDVKKAELIEGVVYVASPVRFNQHATHHAALLLWLGTYWAGTPGVQVGDNASVLIDFDNEPQPDALMLIEPARGGQTRIDDRGYILGSPELVAEVAASSVSIDLNTKMRVYRRNGVKEYLVWRVDDQAIDYFVLRQGQYDPLPLTASTYRSEVFPGLWLDPTALLRHDLPAVLQVLQQGLASAEHAAFVASLQPPAGAP